MTHAETTRPAPLRVGDHLALDFLNTIAAPRGAPVEWLGAGGDLVDWLVGGGVLAATDGARLLRTTERSLFDGVARDARCLREWLRTLVEQLTNSQARGIACGELDDLNAILARYPAHLRLTPMADGVVMGSRRAWTEAGELLAPLAEAIADLIANGDFDLIRKCENPPCTLWFYDRTKGHKRRWCSQAMCGNRAKVAAFRERQKRKG